MATSPTRPALSRESQGILLALLSAACMGVTYVAGKHVMRRITPETFVVFWFTLQAFYALLMLSFRGRRGALVTRASPWSALIGIGTTSAVAILLFFHAIDLIDPALVSFYTRADNLFAVLLGVALLQERFSPREGLGIVLALAGGLVTAYRGGDLIALGLGLCLLSSLMEGLTVILVKVAVRRVGPLVIVFYRSLFAAAMALAYGAATGRLQAPPAATLMVIVAASLPGSFLANVTFYASLARIEVARATAIKALQPFFVLLSAYLVLASLPTARQLLGGAIIVTGILCLLHGRRASPAPIGV